MSPHPMMDGGMGGRSFLRSMREGVELGSRRINRGTARRVMAFARPYRLEIVVFLVTVVLGAVIGVATPVLAGDVVNAITRGGPDAGGTVVLLALLIAGLVAALTNYEGAFIFAALVCLASALLILARLHPGR